MRSAVLVLAAVALALGACSTAGERADGAAVSSAAPPPAPAVPCPYGTIRDAAGNRYCR